MEATLSRPRRVLFVLPDLSVGGAERVCLTLLGHLDRNEFETELFVFLKAGGFVHSIPQDVRVIEGGKAGLCFFSLFNAAIRSDVIIGALELKAIFIASIVGAVLRKPVIGWVHKNISAYLERQSLLKRCIYKVILRFSVHRCRFVVGVSNGVRNDLRGLVPKDASRIRTIYNPFDLDEISGSAAGSVSLKLEGKTILAAGRLTKQKGFDILLKAFSRIVQKESNVRLIILGDGEERKELEMLARELGIDHLVAFPGFHSPYSAMATCSVFVLSSSYEGFGNVLVEALACGAPVVSTDCPSGPREILDDGSIGLLVPVGDPDALSDAIIAMLSNPRLATDYRGLAKVHLQRFSTKTVVKNWTELLGEVA